MRQPLFYHFRPLFFASKNQSQNHVVSKPFLGPPLLIFSDLFSKSVDLGTPFKIECWRSPLSDPLFSRNHSNYFAVGTSWLLKGHSFDGGWLICCFGCVSLCSVLYNIFIIFYKTSVNAQPLSPQFFVEIAAHKKQKKNYFCVCVCVFILFIFMLIFRYPLPTPWARLAPFWIDFGAIVGSIF